ncbi:MAG: shikimate dehydrogenase family protein [Fimbriimonadaceae bacterium]
MATYWREASDEFRMAVIGDPIAQSLSPHMHNQWLQSQGLPGMYTALQVPELETFAALNHLTEMGYLAVNVTTPCKELAFQWCEAISPEAICSLAVNTISLQDRCGTQTDGEALAQMILESAPAQGNVLLLGAGATGRSILCAIKSLYDVSLWNRSKSRQIPPEVAASTKWLESPAPAFDCIINATSAPLDSAELDWALDLAKPSTLVIDVRYSPAGLPKWVETARSMGLRAEDGKQLLARQATLSWEFWLTKSVELPNIVSSPPTTANLLRTLT